MMRFKLARWFRILARTYLSPRVGLSSEHDRGVASRLMLASVDEKIVVLHRERECAVSALRELQTELRAYLDAQRRATHR